MSIGGCWLAPLGWLVALLALQVAQKQSLALDNGLALRPPMGWLAWERFTCQVDCDSHPTSCINSQLFRQMADRLVADKFLESGYEYVNIDDCWNELEREPESERLLANRTRFPEGIAALAEYMHSKNLKLGIYGDCGFKTCGGYPAQLKPAARSYLDDPLAASSSSATDYFELDADTFAEWQIDSFKFDGCHIEALEAERVCPGMSRALGRTRRPVLLICEWPFYMMYAHAKPNYTLASESCNVWRYYDDIEDSWSSILNTIDYTVRHQSTIVKYHGPGHWFDPDQLVIGNFGLSWPQSWAQMALWCIWSAPLYMSNDLRELDGRARDILQNRHLIAINQDPLGVFGQMVKEKRPHDDHGDEQHFQAFVKPITPIRHECPSFALVYLNRNTLGGQAEVSFKLSDLLPGAPLHAAARQASQWAEREPHESEASRAANFSPSRCLKWLQRPESSSDGYDSDNSDDSPLAAAEARFKVFDLIHGKPLEGLELSMADELTLLVEPSGVAAVRLDAIQ